MTKPTPETPVFTDSISSGERGGGSHTLDYVLPASVAECERLRLVLVAVANIDDIVFGPGAFEDAEGIIRNFAGIGLVAPDGTYYPPLQRLEVEARQPADVEGDDGERHTDDFQAGPRQMFLWTYPASALAGYTVRIEWATLAGASGAGEAHTMFRGLTGLVTLQVAGYGAAEGGAA